MGDLNTFQERFVALRHRLIDDGIANGVPFSNKDLQTIVERLQAEGSSFAKVTLPLLGKALDRGLVNGRFEPIINFRSKRNTCLPALCHQVFLEIFEPDGMLRSSPNVVSIRLLRQFLLLDSKLTCEPTPDQQRAAKDGFVQRMGLLRKKRIQTDHPVLLEARRLLGRVLDDTLLDDIQPGHGPGVVAEKRDRFERWDFRTWPSLAERYYPYLTYGTHSLEAWMRCGYGVTWTKEPTTRCCLVPKDFKGPRLISAESAATQYLQQGQMRKLMSYCDHHKTISRSIKFRDQTHNQRAAQKSFACNTVTLDLSNASDTVSVPLVWFLFAEVPRLRRRLMATRSSHMQIDNLRVRLTAFAPMGSAVCFPVESLVFWAISMASLKLVRSHEVTRDGVTRLVCPFRDYALAEEVRVFGDDIIIPEDAFPTLLGTLLEVGCEPNMSKTCWKTPFRESCGSEWFNGIDVTIIRNKEYHYAADNKLEDHLALLNLQRKLFLQGMFSAAALLKDWAEEIHPIYELPVDRVLAGFQSEWSDGDSSSSFDGLLARRMSEKDHMAFGWVQRTRPVKDDLGYQWADPCTESAWNLYHWFSAQPKDRYQCAFGFGYRVSSKLKFRWHPSYHRYECRVPRPFQKARNWPSSNRIRERASSEARLRPHVNEIVLRSEYARLFARMLGDSIERVASRDISVRSAWSILPLPIGLSPDSLKD
jgi:hypothetical protein